MIAGRLVVVAAAEQMRLALVAIALRAAAVLDGAVDGAEQPRAAATRQLPTAVGHERVAARRP